MNIYANLLTLIDQTYILSSLSSNTFMYIYIIISLKTISIHIWVTYLPLAQTGKSDKLILSFIVD